MPKKHLYDKVTNGYNNSAKKNDCLVDIYWKANGQKLSQLYSLYFHKKRQQQPEAHADTTNTFFSKLGIALL